MKKEVQSGYMQRGDTRTLFIAAERVVVKASRMLKTELIRWKSNFRLKYKQIYILNKILYF